MPRVKRGNRGGRGGGSNKGGGISKADIEKTYLEKLSDIVDTFAKELELEDLKDKPLFQDESLTETLGEEIGELPSIEEMKTDTTTFLLGTIESKLIQITQENQKRSDAIKAEEDEMDTESSDPSDNDQEEQNDDNNNDNRPNKNTLQVERDEVNNEFLLKILILLDISIYFSDHFEGLDNLLPIKTFVTLLTSCCSLEFLVYKLGPIFFSSSNFVRRMKITGYNKMVAKLKTGSNFLNMGNKLLEKPIDQLQEYDLFSAKLRSFLLNAFDPSDKLMLTHDWKMNTTNKQYIDFADHYTRPKKVNDEYLKKGSLFGGVDIWFTCCTLFYQFSMNLDRLVKSLNSYSKDYDKSEAFIAQKIPLCIKHALNGLDYYDDHVSNLPKPRHQFNDKDEKITQYYNDKIYQPDWILSEVELNKQMSNYRNRLCLYTQCLIMTSFLKDFVQTKWAADVKKINAKFPKIRVPSEFQSWLRVARVQEMESLYKKASDALKTHYQFYHRIATDVVENTESTWRIMKLKQFNHEDIDALQELSSSKKRKFEEYMSDSNSNSNENNYKKPYYNKMGTPKLSKIWKVETGLDEVKTNSRNTSNDLNDYKDDLYFLKGKIELGESEVKNLKEKKDAEDEGKTEHQKLLSKAEKVLKQANEDKSLLTWKSLRLSRTQGYWTKFNQVNEIIGLDGLDNSHLIETYERESALVDAS